MTSPMKKNLLRNNLRKLHANQLQSKTIHSQSPTHKKLLKKIELTQREAPNQYELSLQDNLIYQKPQEEVVDFRVEIERRYQKSIANHTFVFPRKKIETYEDGSDHSTSSQESSIDSLRHVTVYELVSQNKKRIKPPKLAYRTQDEYSISGRVGGGTIGGVGNHSYRVKDSSDYRIRTEPDQTSSDGEYDTENPDTPIEIRIRDKNSTTYKKLLKLLEQQLNKAPDNAPTTKKQPEFMLNDENYARDDRAAAQYIQQQQETHLRESGSKKETSKEKKTTPATIHVMKNNLVKDDSQRTLGYHIGKMRVGVESEIKVTDKSESALSFQEGVMDKVKKSTKTPEMAQRMKASAQGREKVTSFMETSHGGESHTSLDSRVSPNAKRALNDFSKISQEAKKKVYSVANANALLRSLTPKYIAGKALANMKDKSDRTTGASTQAETYLSSKTPSSSLYQKAQDDVLNGKLKVTTQKSQKRSNEAGDSLRGDRDDGPQSAEIKGINFVDVYASPKGQVKGMGQTMYNSFAKVRNMRKMEGSVGDKSSERQNIYASYDLTSKKGAASAIAGKPAFKLDLSNRVQKQRDLLSSTRTRENQSKEKSTDLLSVDSILKGSYDMHNHSLVRNAAKQAEASKKKLGITPKGTVSKNALIS